MFTLKSIEIGVVWRVLGEELCIGTTLTVIIFKEKRDCAILHMGNTMVESFMSDLNIKNEVLRELNNLIILGTKRNEGDIFPSWEVHCGVGNFKIFTTCRIDGCQNWLWLCNWDTTLANTVDSLLQQGTQHDSSIECTVILSITDWHSPSSMIKKTVELKSCTRVVCTVTSMQLPSLTL